MAAPPPTKRHPGRSLLDLGDDLIPEILLRVPPYKPERLIRCSAVCKPWRRLLTDPAFLRRYREFHGAPPMLGFIFNLDLPKHRVFARFARTTSFRPRTLDHGDWHAHDSRHGRVVLHAPSYAEGDTEILVWDPVTDERWELPLPASASFYWVAAVLCAAPVSGRECDHLDCHGGPFLVAFLGTDDDGRTSACVYSSEAAAWGDATNAEHRDVLDDRDMRPSALVGSTVYFISAQSKTIVEYDLGRRQLAFIDPPFVPRDYAVLMPAVGGGLEFAAVQGTCLYLCSREAGLDGTAAWTQRRVIELNTLPTRSPRSTPAAAGFAEGLDAIFVRTDTGVFAIELKSGRVKKVSSRGSIDTVIPYMSFYTPDHATV